MKSKDLYPSIFSRHAQAYDRRLDQIMASGEARGRQRVLDLVDARPGMRILDLACGPGNMARRLAAAVAPGGEVVGVDLAPGMIEVARSVALPNARFELMDIEELSFPTASFDAATCGHGLQFAPHLDRALWQSADQLVALFTSWWDCAVRMERLTDEQRAAFIDDALQTLQRGHTGTIETASRSLVLDASA